MIPDVDALVCEAVRFAAGGGPVPVISVTGTQIGAGLKLATDIGLCEVFNAADPLAMPRNAYRLTDRGRRFVASLGPQSARSAGSFDRSRRGRVYGFAMAQGRAELRTDSRLAGGVCAERLATFYSPGRRRPAR